MIGTLTIHKNVEPPLECRDCGKKLDGMDEGGDYFGMYNDVNDLVPQYYLCYKCLRKRAHKYIRMMFNPATGNYDWRIERIVNGEIVPRSLGTGWHKGKPTIADTHDVAFSKTLIHDYIHD